MKSAGQQGQSSLQGGSAKARTAYQDLLALWKDADPDAPPREESEI